MLASTPALASEYTPDKIKDFWVSLVISGYPWGAVLSGIVAAYVVLEYGWRAMYRLAGIGTFFTLPLIWFFLAESLDFLFTSNRKNALEHANRILAKMSLPQLKKLLEISADKAKAKLSSLFTSDLKQATTKLWFAFFLHFVFSTTSQAGFPNLP